MQYCKYCKALIAHFSLYDCNSFSLIHHLSLSVFLFFLKVALFSQDVTQKLIESCNTVAGSSLESAAWFRRSLAVIPQAPGATTEDDQSSSAVESEVSESEPATTTSTVASGSSNYSTQALIVLAELLAPLLDVMFGSEEKDRVTNLLTTVMYNVTPYLRNHRYAQVNLFWELKILKKISNQRFHIQILGSPE